MTQVPQENPASMAAPPCAPIDGVTIGEPAVTSRSYGEMETLEQHPLFG
jgi:hypothetical protein